MAGQAWSGRQRRGYTAGVSSTDDDSPMARVYTLVILCHATVITLLWLLGRTFSH
jgi:hypothetical protein